MRRWWIGLSLVFMVLLAADVVPALRGGWGWQWDYSPAPAGPVAILGGVLLLYLAGVWATRRWGRGRLAWALLGTVLISLAVVNVRGDAAYLLFTRSVSPVYTGSSAAAVRNIQREGVESALQRWPELMQELAADANIHTALSPPGQPLLHHWAGQGLERFDGLARPLSLALRPYQCSDPEIMRYSRGELASVALLGMGMPLWAGLALFPLYALARHLQLESAAAAGLAQWWALLPSLAFFAPSWNTLYPLLVTGAFALLAWGLSRERSAAAFGAGLIMSLATFLNFSVVPALLLLGLYALGWWYFYSRRSFAWIVGVGAVFGLGLSLCWLLFGLYTGYTPLDILQSAFDQHLGIERNYWLWLLLHPYDLFLFAGLPLVAVSLWGLWGALPSLAQQFRQAQHPPLARSHLLAGALALTLLILMLSNVARGETARVWLFFVPFLLLSGAALFQRSPTYDLPLMAAQGAMLLTLAAVIGAMPSFLNPPPQQPRSDVPSYESAQPADALFRSSSYRGEFRLQGYNVIPDPARQVLTLAFQWQGITPTERPYHFEASARAENPSDGVVQSAPFRWQPQGANYLSPCWQADDLLWDTVVMPLPPVSEPVQWTLSLRAIDERSGDQMQVIGPEGAQGNEYHFPPIAYP